jgi:predicted DNA-binding ribbon-helix-helix protein
MPGPNAPLRPLLYSPCSGEFDGADAKVMAVIKRSIFINGHKTSVSLEDEFWHGLHEVARLKNVPVPKLVEQIDQERNNNNLSSAIRVFVFKNLTK